MQLVWQHFKRAHTHIPLCFNETAGSGKFENNVRQVVGGEFMLYVGRWGLLRLTACVCSVCMCNKHVHFTLQTGNALPTTATTPHHTTTIIVGCRLSIVIIAGFWCDFQTIHSCLLLGKERLPFPSLRGWYRIKSIEIGKDRFNDFSLLQKLRLIKTIACGIRESWFSSDCFFLRVYEFVDFRCNVFPLRFEWKK